jgi:hypothetical protein
MSQTEPVAHHFFTNLHTHDFVGIGEVGYLQRNFLINFLQVFFLA